MLNPEGIRTSIQRAVEVLSTAEDGSTAAADRSLAFAEEDLRRSLSEGESNRSSLPLAESIGFVRVTNTLEKVGQARFAILFGDRERALACANDALRIWDAG